MSNGDVGYQGRTAADRVNMTGTTHGSIVEVEGQWYVFYHRLTHKSDYSRQSCAEKIVIRENGSIPQVEITSCGLNEGPLRAEGSYPAVICCNLTNGHMPTGSNSIYTMLFPNVTHRGDERFLAEIENGTTIGYKYFDFKGVTQVGITIRKETEHNRVVYEGPVRLDERCDEEVKRCQKEMSCGRHIPASLEVYVEDQSVPVGRLALEDKLEEGWTQIFVPVTITDGMHPLYLVYRGSDRIQMKELCFQ